MSTRDHLDEIWNMRERGNSLQEIGDKFGVSRERIRQIIGNTKGMRKFASDKLLDVFSVNMTTGQASKISGLSYGHASHVIGKFRHVPSGNGSCFGGYNGENVVAEKLVRAGFDCVLQSLHENYDILVNNIIKIDVKTAYAARHSLSRAKTQKSPYYTFNIRNNRDCIDFYILYIVPTDDIFIVPAKVLPIRQILVSWPTLRPELGKVQKYRNRFDLLWNFTPRNHISI